MLLFLWKIASTKAYPGNKSTKGKPRIMRRMLFGKMVTIIKNIAVNTLIIYRIAWVLILKAPCS
jgi:hypothetical protein